MGWGGCPHVIGHPLTTPCGGLYRRGRGEWGGGVSSRYRPSTYNPVWWPIPPGGGGVVLASVFSIHLSTFLFSKTNTAVTSMSAKAKSLTRHLAGPLWADTDRGESTPVSNV